MTAPVAFDPLADAFRRWGYLEADLDRLGRLAPARHPDTAAAAAGRDAKEVEFWRTTYAGAIGFEFMHLRDPRRREWFRDRVESPLEPVDRRYCLRRIMETELFERFLHARYVGTKRFSIDGIAVLIPLLDAVLDASADRAATQLYLAMSHRGRLAVMRNIVGIPAAHIFASMDDVDPRSVLGSGDVKYHLGATGTYQTKSGAEVEVHLSTNPSHLEAVDPVVMGRARARQERLGDGGSREVLPVTIHGDAAFSGQGIVAETLNLSALKNYGVGGTIQVIANNLLGFTAEPTDLHSSLFSSDAGCGPSVPVIHVNGESPDAVWRAGRLAAEYRDRFGADIVVDVIGFRRYGHSEVEDPTTTQPVLYARIKERRMLWEDYAEEIGAGADETAGLRDQVTLRYDEEQEAARASSRRPSFWQLPGYWAGFQGGRYDARFEVDTAVPLGELLEVGERLTEVPDGFHVHDKVRKLLDQRREMAQGNRPVDWGMAEALSLGSLLRSGVPVRLTGQDTRRGTFNHRHAVLIDVESGTEFTPLMETTRRGATFCVADSPLSEAAVLGFEYGYSREFPDKLVCWEAQFGDFANGAQIVIDQYLCAAEDKWGLLSGIVLLLPHGYEGQGPEHSSARIERFLALAAEDNIQVCQPSTAAQYFHLLRRQALRKWRKPLVVFTPKSMLRARRACSGIDDFSSGKFAPIIQDDDVAAARTIIVCAGKIAHELRAERERTGAVDRAIVTVEQFYPFPEVELESALGRHGRRNNIVWVQEEPANMGALSFMKPRLQRLGGGRHVTSVKRFESAGPATGSAKAHALEQQTLVKLALSS